MAQAPQERALLLEAMSSEPVTPTQHDDMMHPSCFHILSILPDWPCVDWRSLQMSKSDSLLIWFRCAVLMVILGHTMHVWSKICDALSADSSAVVLLQELNHDVANKARRLRETALRWSRHVKAVIMWQTQQIIAHISYIYISYIYNYQ